jgi:DNA-binding transcriptional regulator LsrR (DeoR family)
MTHAADVGGQIAPRSRNTVRSEHNAGQSQRGIARALDIDRRMVKRIILEAA